jgi:hypothetical protein
MLRGCSSKLSAAHKAVCLPDQDQGFSTILALPWFDPDKFILLPSPVSGHADNKARVSLRADQDGLLAPTTGVRLP